MVGCSQLTSISLESTLICAAASARLSNGRACRTQTLADARRGDQGRRSCEARHWRDPHEQPIDCVDRVAKNFPRNEGFSCHFLFEVWIRCQAPERACFSAHIVCLLGWGVNEDLRGVSTGRAVLLLVMEFRKTRCFAALSFPQRDARPDHHRCKQGAGSP